MKILGVAGFALSVLVATPFPASALDVVASIKPVHSLVASVMAGAGEPQLLVRGGGSPHTYALRPSEARALEQAEIVFWIGHDLEVFLRGPLETLAQDARVVALDEAPGVVTLPFREGGAFDAHGHDKHDEHEEHGEHGEDHAEHADEEHDHDHAHEAIDAHLWLDPLNARAMVNEIALVLADADPANAALYSANAQKTSAALDALVAEVDALVAPVRDRRFVVFHDAYQYFETRFGMVAAGSITVSPEAIPGVQRIAEIHHRVEELGATCVFAEPQFESRLVAVVTEGTPAKAGVLDPLGADLTDGPDLYFELIRNLAGSLRNCLQ